MTTPISASNKSFVEAVTHFNRFSQDELRDCLDKFDRPLGGLIQNQRDRIRDSLLSGDITLESAWDYIDQLEECGEQQIFLYHFAADAAHMLDPLRQVRPLRDLLIKYATNRTTVDEKARTLLQHLESAWHAGVGKPVLDDYDEYCARTAQQRAAGKEVQVVHRNLYQPPAIELAGVYLRSTPNRLVLKFVETRSYTVQVQIDGGFTPATAAQRATSYIVLDFDASVAQFRLRALPPRATLSMRQELDLLVGELRALLGEFPFVALVIEPVIRRLLMSGWARRSTPALEVTDWKVVTSEGKPLGGGVNPSLVQKVLLKFEKYTCIRLVGDWKTDDDVVRAGLVGRNNEVGIPKPRVKEAGVAAVLRKIMNARQRKLHVEQIRRIAEQNEKWRPALINFDRLFHDGKKESIPVQKMAKDTWTPVDEAVEAAHALRNADPAAFALKFYVRCPETQRWVRQAAPSIPSDKPAPASAGKKRRQRPAAKPVAFDDPANVPPKIQCQHSKPRRILIHDTAGMIEAELTYKSGSQAEGILPIVSKYLRERSSAADANAYFVPIALLIFFVFFTGAIAGASWVFSLLAERFPNNGFIPLAGFSLVLFFGTGVVVRALGPPATTVALKVFRAIVEIPRTVLGFGTKQAAADAGEGNEKPQPEE